MEYQTGKIKVLLIEDSNMDALFIKRVLERAKGVSFDLETVALLEPGLNRLVEKKFDIVLTDLGLPDSRGFKTFEKVYAQARNTPVVVLTGLDDEEVAVKAIQSGAQDYLIKGKIGSDLLVRSIRYAIERYRSEKALKESKEEWERTFDAIDDIITIMDPDMSILRMNRAALQVLNGRSEDFIGKYCYQLHGYPEACKQCPAEKVIREHKSVTGEIEHIHLGKTFQVTLSPLLDENVELIGFVHIAKDISEKRKIEAHLRQIQIMEALGTLAGGIAHDLNNILFPIFGYTEMTLEGMPEGSTGRRNLEQVIKAAERAKSMVEQILTFSRQSHEGRKELKPWKLQPVIKETLKLLRGSLPTTIGIRKNIDEKCGYVLSDPTQIHQILMNLCANAYHAMREKGGILEVNLNEVSVQSDNAQAFSGIPSGSYLKLSVSDTGQGMDKATMEKIFEPYFTTKKSGEGTGLGLSVVKEIVKNHNGHITVRSVPGHLTVFDVWLPLADVKAVQPKLPPPESLQRGHERILLVDDEEVITRMLEQILEHLGYKVTSMTSSLETLEIFRRSPESFDLVITDMTMPSMTGSDLAKELISIRPDIPILIATGFSETVTPEKIASLGIKGYIRKPVSVAEMAKTIRQVLDNEK